MNIINKVVFHFPVLVLLATFCLSPVYGEDTDKEKAEKEKQEDRARHIYSAGEIIIYGRAIPQIEKATNTTVISSEEIEEHSDKTLDDSLKSVPGIQVGVHKKGYVRARFRGFDQNKVAILIDGVPINDVFSTDIDISNIPLNNVEQIIVNRGATSALLGTFGVVGVINIITKKPDAPYYEIGAEYGQYNNWLINAAHGAPLGDFYYWINAAVQHSGGYEISKKMDSKKRRKWFDRLVRYDLYGLNFEDLNLPAVDGYINDTGIWNHNDFTQYSLATKLGYRIDDKSEAGITAEYYFKTADTSSYQLNAYSNYKAQNNEWADPVFDVSDPMDIKNAAFRNRSFVWPAIHNVRVSPYFTLDYNKCKLKGNAYYTYMTARQEKYATTDHSWPGDTVLADTVLEPFYTIKEYLTAGANLYPSWKIAPWNTLNFALLGRYSLYQENEQAISAAVSPNIAATLFGTDPYPVQRLDVSYFTVAVEDEINYKDRLNISLGVSYDTQILHSFKNREALYQFEDAYIVAADSKLLGTKDSINPVAGLIYTPVRDRLILRAAGSIKTRFPDLSEYSKIVDDRRDNRLKPERSYNGNTGFELFFFDSALSLRADYFVSVVKDRIEKISGGIDPPVNIGRVDSQGLESIISYTREGIWDIMDMTLVCSYTYLYTRNRDDSEEEKINKGEIIEFTPSHQISADLRLKFKGGTGLNIWGYSTMNQYVYCMKERPEPGPVQTPFSTEYFEAVRLHDPVMLNIRLSRSFLIYYEVYVMCKNLLDDYEADPFIPGPGRMFYGGCSAKF